MGDTTPDPSQPKPPQASSKREVISLGASFSGPLPHPSALKAYEEACPGAAERIISMAEKQGDHRRALELKAANAAIEDMRRGYWVTHAGQACALAVALCLITGGVYVAANGNPGWGTAMGGGGILGGVTLQGMISAFMRNKKPDEQVTVTKPPRRKPK